MTDHNFNALGTAASDSPSAGVPELSALDELATRPAPRPRIRIPVPNRPFELEVTPNWTSKEQIRYEADHPNRDWKPGMSDELRIDPIAVGARVVAAHTEAIWRTTDGTQVTDDTGTPVTFRSTSLAARIQKANGLAQMPGHVGVVLSIFETDVHVMEAAGKIQAASVEYAEEHGDPTRPSPKPS